VRYSGVLPYKQVTGDLLRDLFCILSKIRNKTSVYFICPTREVIGKIPHSWNGRRVYWKLTEAY